MADSELTFDLSDPKVAHRPASGIDPGLLEGNALALVGRGALAGLRDFGSSLWNFIKVPGDVAAGKYSPEEIKELAPGYALGLAGMGTPAGVAMVPENALGIFGGTKSLTAPKVKLWGAQTLEKMGAGRDPIYEKTGWFRGPDGKWRYTISDEGAQTLGSFRVGKSEQPLSNVLLHPELYQAYPELSDWKFEYSPKIPSWGATNPVTKSIQLSDMLPSGERLPILLHETQHAVQDIEGFARGGAAREFLPEEATHLTEAAGLSTDLLNRTLNKILPKNDDRIANIMGSVFNAQAPFNSDLVKNLPRYVQDHAKYAAERVRESHKMYAAASDKYTRLGGEVEARAVQEQLERGDWTTPVWTHEGYIPFENQIILGKNEKAARGLIPVDHDPFASSASLTPVEYDPFDLSAYVRR